MKRPFATLCLLTGVLVFAGCVNRSVLPDSEPTYSLNLSDMRVRDPFILANVADSTYYMHANSGKGSFICFASKDLRMWRHCGESFIPAPDFWGKRDFWAPKVDHYQGRFYLIASFYSKVQQRGISILVSDYPDRDFQPLVNAPITPSGWLCLDGSLYIDKDKSPWLIYAREWIEVENGEIYAQRLSEDLKHTAGPPILLCRGSDSDWAGLITTGTQTGIVTNAPFIYTTDNGKLLLLWSSFRTNGEYAIGTAISHTGNLCGPWKQQSNPLNDDGGHAMLFRDFEGLLLISYHTNEPPVQIILRPVRIERENLIFLN